MIRWLLILALLLVVASYEDAPVVSEKAEREHLAKVVLHTCAATATSPPALERCHAAGLRAVDRLASTGEWAWRK